MNIFYFSAEVEPFAKSGGLGDVLGALPKAIAKTDNVYVVMPYYTDIIKQQYKDQMEYLGYFYTDVSWRHQYVGVMQYKANNVTYLFLDNEFYFTGPMYCFADNERFAFFCKASLDLVCWLGIKADILHVNDWSTALIPVLRHAFYGYNKFLLDTRVVYTIHNLKYQGFMGKDVCQDFTGLPDWYFDESRMLHNGWVNLMKGAIVFSDAVTTVSDTYSHEIETPRFGEGLQDVIARYHYKVRGILNGVDYGLYNPLKDNLIAKKYGISKMIAGKRENKVALQQQLGLPVRENTAMLALISRFVDQKGLELVAESLGEILQRDVQLVVLGTGEKHYEAMFKSFAERYPDKVSANIYFDNVLAHKIYAAADFVLVPSVYEPCGLTQLIGLKYGAVPIVRETGGLKDTILSYNEITGEGNGFSFAETNAHDFAYTVNRALNFYYSRKTIFREIQRRGMRQDYSWKESAGKYLALYHSLVG